MANEFGLFWDSQGGDRLYNADSMEEWLKPFFVTGVFNGHLQVTSSGGMNVSVATGYCNVEGKVRYFDNVTNFKLDAASGTYNRVDTIVIERNDGDRMISLKVVKGGSDGQPIAPVRESGIYQLVIAQIAVGRGVTEITQSNITDTRTDSILCGYVVATVDEINFDEIVSQFTTWFNEYKEEIIDDFSDAGRMAQEIFNTWFQHMKDQLDSDAAGHLQLEIDAINDEVGMIDGETGLEDSTTIFNDDGSITQTYANKVKTTTFNADGSITELVRHRVYNTTIFRKTTVFNDDGSITENITKGGNS